MADRAITALNEATSMTDADLFAISQGGQAKKVTWVTFYSYLAEALDGHGGIKDIDYTSPSSGSLEGILTITLGDDTEESFVITNGRGITSISKTGTSGLTDTYTISYNNGTTSTFTIQNGRGITGITKTTSGLTDTYTIAYNDNTTSQIVLTNGKGITGIADKWAVSTSNSTVPSTWYDDPQTMTPENKYEWHYQIVSFNDGTTLDTDKAVTGVYGDTGQDWHVFIKWSAEEPDSDADMKDTADNWIGFYSGTASTAPTTYASYTWFEYKGEKGDTGVGITSVALYSSSGLIDTYRVTFSDGSFTSFNLTNGSSIESITKTSTSGLTDTYTVTLTNGTTTSFQVVNGKGISSITEVDVTHAAGHTDIYRINFNDGDTYSFSIYNGTNGSGSVSTVDNIASDGNQNVALLLLGQGAPTTSTAGFLKQRYFDQVNSILYICVGVDTSGAETTYDWRGTGVTVDSALSSMSTNPVQNAILTAIIGTATLDTTAQTLTGAVNELKSAADSNASEIADLEDIVGDGQLSGFTATDLTGAANELKDTLNTLVKEIARPNLLDNWYFVGGGSQKRYGTFPINQKGQTSYSTNGTTNIDRWISYNTSSLVVESNGVKIVPSATGFVLTQNVDEYEDLLGKTLTATALFASVSGGTAGIRLEIGGTVYSGTDLTSGGLTRVTHEVPSNAAGIKVDIRMTEGTTAKLIAIKLEIGSEQTLAYQTQSGWEVIGIPSFSEELAKAQAYYFKATNFAAEYAGAIGAGATLIRFLVPLPCQMVSSATNVTLQETVIVYFTNSSNASTFVEIGTGKSITFTVSDVKVEPVGVRISLALSDALPSGAFRFCLVEADNIIISA